MTCSRPSSTPSRHSIRARAFLVFLAFIGLLGVHLGSAPGVHAASIIYSNDVLGEIESCGCRKNPLGGMSRKAAYLSGLKAAEPAIIQLDAGDLFFETDQIPGQLRKQRELQAEYLVKVLNDLGHTAFVPGEKDFALGTTGLKKLRSSAKFDFLAANLKDKRSGKPLFKASAIYTLKESGKKPIRIGVVGLVGETLRWPQDLKATPLIEAARQQVRKLRSKADYVVALTHQGYEKDLQLAKTVKGIDLIIGAHTQDFLQQPVRIGSTFIFQSSYRNQHVGRIRLEKPFEFETKGHELVALGPEFDPAPTSPFPEASVAPSPTTCSSSTDKLVTEFKSKLAEISSAPLASEKSAASPAKFQTFPRCTDCHPKQFDFWRKTRHARALQALFKDGSHLKKECLGCHSLGFGNTGVATEGFREIAQAAEYQPDSSRDGISAAEVLSTEAPTKPFSPAELNDYLNSVADAKSLDSQIRLADAPPRPLRESIGKLTRSFVPVQCENCHTAYGEHPFSSVAPLKKEVAKDACLKCHTSERAPEWYAKPGQPNWEKIQKKRAEIACPAGEP